MRDARGDPALRRLSRRACTRRRISCATTSACASRASTPPTPNCSRRSTRSRMRGLRRRAATARRCSLTYFEFGTLAALWLFARAGLDALVLEVGLGGRLDAVNVVDADVAVLTSVGDRPHGLPGADARGHRPRKGGHLPRRPSGGLRRSASAGERARARAGDRRAASAHRPRLRIHERSARSGSTGGRAASASACRFPRCAARTS